MNITLGQILILMLVFGAAGWQIWRMAKEYHDSRKK